MITKKTIDNIYRKYNRPPYSIEQLNIGLLIDYVLEKHDIAIDDEKITIGSLSPDSPFSTIRLSNIHEILEFDSSIAIVLPHSIIFLNKDNSDVNIHINMSRPPLLTRLKMLFSKK